MSTESQQQRSFSRLVEDRFHRVAMEPDRERKFPVGPESAKRLGYGCGEIDALPSPLTESFRGAGNPAHRGQRLAGPSVPCSATPDRALNLAPRTWFDRAGLQSPMPRRRRIRRCIKA